MNPTVLALIICGAAAVAESALAGSGVCQRLAQLRMPAYSPPFALWLVIGLLFYAMCFIVLRHLLGGAASSGPQLVALMLLILVLVANALWNVLFFRWRDLRASFVAFIPYAVVVAALVAVLFRVYPFGAALFACYCMYLIYATWWVYNLWRLNTSTPNSTL